jgi:hypothetical protein
LHTDIVKEHIKESKAIEELEKTEDIWMEGIRHFNMMQEMKMQSIGYGKVNNKYVYGS